MTRLVTLPNCRHNIVINTLFLEPEMMSGFNSIWLFSVFHPLDGNSVPIEIGEDGMGQNKRG